jgi:hypothetical protein
MAESASGMRFVASKLHPESQVAGPRQALRRPALAEGTSPPWAHGGILRAVLSQDRAPPARVEILIEALEGATSVQEIADALLGHPAWIGRRGAIFLHVHGELRGWAGRGRGVTAATLARARLALDRRSVLSYLATTPASYRGRIHHDGRSRSFLIDAMTSVPDEITAFSITHRARVVGVGYADQVFAQMRGRDLERLGRELGAALALARPRSQPTGPNHDERISH